MASAFLFIGILARLYTYVLIARIIIEMIHSFSRNFTAPRWFTVIAELIFRVTDPPVMLLRRVIPPLRLGGVALDVSILVLFFALYLISSFAFAYGSQLSQAAGA